MAGRSYTLVTNSPVSGKISWTRHNNVKKRSVTHGDLSLDLSAAFLQWVTNKQVKLRSDLTARDVCPVHKQPRDTVQRCSPQLPDQLADRKKEKVASPNLKDLIFRTNKTVYNVDSNRVTLKAGLSKRYKYIKYK